MALDLLLLLLLLLACACAVSGSNCTAPPTECAAWAAFFDSTSGSGWKSCSGAQGNPCGCREHVECSIDGRVTSLTFDGDATLNGFVIVKVSYSPNGLCCVRPIPPALGALEKLQSLTLRNQKVQLLSSLLL